MPISSETAKRVGRLGGRPKGSKAPATIEKEAALKQFNLRVASMADKLLNSQAIVALGTHRMVTVEVDDEGKKHIKTVRDETRMQNLLDTGVYGKDYLILEGSPAEWKAANALLDRAFGKAKESIDISGEVKFSLKGLSDRRKAIELSRDEVKVIE